MISILVLTLNEENNLPSCLESVKWSDDIHVLDSYSRDRTVEIARDHGAHLWFRKFDSFAQHQNWALSNVTFKYPWVLYLDADERVTPELAAAAQKAVADPHDFVAFKIQRRDFFLDTWLKHVQMTAYYDRLFRPEKMRYERLGHCVSKPDGPISTINGYLDHYPFSKGIGDWVSRHNFYSSQEAQQAVINRESNQPGTISLKEMVSGDTSERRQKLKDLFYRLPMRPFLKFIVMYVLKRGFLDGRAGFVYSVLISYYEFLIILKIRELLTEQSAPGSNRESLAGKDSSKDASAEPAGVK